MDGGHFSSSRLARACSPVASEIESHSKPSYAGTFAASAYISLAQTSHMAEPRVSVGVPKS